MICLVARGLSTLSKASALPKLISKLTPSKPQICCSLFSAKSPLAKSPVKNLDEGSPIGKKRKQTKKLVLSSDEEEEENVSPK